MLKFAKKLLIVVGLIVAVAAFVFMLYEWTLATGSLRNIVAAATANNSNPEKAAAFAATVSMVWLPIVAALVGGLVLGLGIGIPSETFKQRYEERQAQAARKLEAGAAQPGAAVK